MSDYYVVDEAYNFGETVGPKVEVMVSESSSDQVGEASHERGNLMDQDEKESYKGMDMDLFLTSFHLQTLRHDCTTNILYLHLNSQCGCMFDGPFYGC